MRDDSLQNSATTTVLGHSVGLASDHAAPALRALVKSWLHGQGFEVRDYGTETAESVDYPDYAARLSQGLLTGEVSWGVALCGTGQGMNMALNRYPQVRAALCDSETLARLARAHNDANVMVLGGRVSGSLVAEACLQAFTTTAFAAGRHARRVAKLSAKPLEDIKT